MPPLPNDVLRHVFDELEFESLIAVSHVSRAWRLAAHGHPTFSRFIEFIYHKVDDPPSAAADFLLTRALATSGIIHLCIFMSQPSVFVKDVVFPLVGMCMPRLEDLRLVVHWSFSVDLLKVLEQPAPRLKWLRFDALKSSQPLVLTLHPTFLGGSAPLLETIHTRGFTSAPGKTIIPGITATKKLIYEKSDAAEEHPILRTMLDLLPNLECLTLNDAEDWSDSDVGGPAYSLSKPLRKLEILDPISVQCLAILASPDTQHIKINAHAGHDIRVDGFELMVSSLAGALQLTFSWDLKYDSLWYLLLTDVDGRERQLECFEEDPLELTSDITPVIPIFSPLAHRITRATVDITLWEYMAVVFPESSSIESLVLTIHGPIPEDYLTSQVKWPRLKTIVIIGPRRTPVDVLWLANFMGHILGCVARGKLNLHLKGCVLDGDPELIWGFFDEIKLFRA